MDTPKPMRRSASVDDPDTVLAYPAQAIHVGCGQVAFYAKWVLGHGDTLRAKDVLLLDGTPAVSGTLARCGSCGRAVQLVLDDPAGLRFEFRPEARR